MRLAFFLSLVCLAACGGGRRPGGPLVDSGVHPPPTDSGLHGATPDGGGPDAAHGVDAAVHCTGNESGCDCGTGVTGSVTSCGEATITPSVCCANDTYPATDTVCSCRTWGCSDATSAGGHCSCGWIGAPRFTRCSPVPPSICCASDTGPSCYCDSLTSTCPAGYREVGDCDIATITCGAAYTLPRRISVCL